MCLNRTLLSLSLLLAAGVIQANGSSLLMTEAEMTLHAQQMKMLQGAERENYRDKTYEALRLTAKAKGYKLPSKPIWKVAEAPAAANKIETKEKISMPEIISQQRAVLERAINARKSQIEIQNRAYSQMNAQQQANMRAMSEYRINMRNRFEKFMAQREAQFAVMMKQQQRVMQKMAISQQRTPLQTITPEVPIVVAPREPLTPVQPQQPLKANSQPIQPNIPVRPNRPFMPNKPVQPVAPIAPPAPVWSQAK